MSSHTDLPETDSEGFLRNLDDWSEDIAVELAKLDDITLTEDHWEIIRLVQDYYDTYRLFPQNRVLVKRVGEAYGIEKGTSIHLMTLFTGKPAKVIARVAGLPKPPNCD